MAKTLIRVMVVVLLAIMVATVVNADGYSFKDIDTSTVTDNATDNTEASGRINKMIGAVLTVTQVIGVGVAVIMLIVLAIKYISASPGDKADIKKHAVVYVVGSVVLFAASGILQIIKQFAGNLNES